MAIFAILNNNSVMNVIIADTKEIAVKVTPPFFDIVEVTETTGVANVGYNYVDGAFVTPVFNETPAE